MNLFRRLFSQPPTPSEPGTSAPASDLNAPGQISKTLETQAAEFGFGAAVDGVTRPLQEPPTASVTTRGHLVFGMASDVGMVRSNNQDAAYTFFSTARTAEERPDFGLFIVADGMGGHHDGEKASAITARVVATQIMNTLFLPMLSGDQNINQVPIAEVLIEAVNKANADIVAKVPDGGTTLTATLIINDLAYVAHVGDSRIYLINKTHIEQITRDHSLVQRLIELDQITRDNVPDYVNTNVLYRALGQSDNVEIDTMTRRLPPRSGLMLCSDGLWNQVKEREMLEIIARYPNDPQEACNRLVALANERGGVDNVTVVLLYVPG